MVRDFYALQGFEKLREEEAGTVWKFEIPDVYEKKNRYIEIRQGGCDKETGMEPGNE